MKKQFWLIIILAVVIIILAGALLWPQSDNSYVKNLSIKSGQKISSPLALEGEARSYFFEGSFPVKITDEAGNILGQSYVQATADWMTENFVPFKGEISFVSEKEQKGFLVLMRDNPSGLPEGDAETKIPVVIKQTDTMKIKAYFNNNKMDPEYSCNKVFSVDRQVPRTEAVARVALEELLKGPTDTEKSAGFFTSINPGVNIQKLTIENGVAKVDFDEQLEYQVGGSCRVSAIRAEITETLKQFSTVQNVIISINGRTEDILQP